MVNFFANNFEHCIWLAIVLIAIIPTLEGKIAIPFALSFSSQISPIFAFLLAFLGSIIPSLPAMYITRIIKNKSKAINRIINEKYNNKITAINNKKNNLKKLCALSLFVAIPLPLTGVWSGSIIAGLTNLNILKSFLSICIGAFISNIIILIISLLFENKVIYFLIFSLIILLIFTLIKIISIMIKKRKSK